MAFLNLYMKWTFLSALLCAVLLTGCRKNEIVYLEQTVQEETTQQVPGQDETREQHVSGQDETREQQASRQDGTDVQPETEDAQEETIAVFVCGAVNRPGVYMLPVYARANDALEAAGGFRDDADTQWCNLARHLSDGQRLRIYTAAETQQMKEEGVFEEGAPGSAADGAQEAPDGAQAEGSDAQGRIDLNTASKEELMTLPGIGQARAEAILAWRREHGPFSDTEQIKQISGFKDAIYESIRELVTVG